MVLIGLGAKARQGKNFVASYMKEQAESKKVGVTFHQDGSVTPIPQTNVKLYAFAEELKLYCKEHHDELVWQHYKATKLDLLPPKEDSIYGYTQILQWYGTNVVRVQDPDTWVKALDRRLAVEQPEFALITDVRFLNEANYVKEKGGTLVKVVRLNEDGTQFLDVGRDPNHPSETALDDYEEWDYIITAKDGDLKGLRQKSIGVWSLATNPEEYEIYSYADEPDYGDTVLEFLNSDATGFFE